MTFAGKWQKWQSWVKWLVKDPQCNSAIFNVWAQYFPGYPGCWWSRELREVPPGARGFQVTPGHARMCQALPQASPDFSRCYQVSPGQGLPGDLRTVTCHPGLRERAGGSSCCPGNCQRGPRALDPWEGQKMDFTLNCVLVKLDYLDYLEIIVTSFVFSFVFFMKCEQEQEVQPSWVSHVGSILSTSCHPCWIQRSTSCQPSLFVNFKVFYNFYSGLELGVPIQARICMVQFNIPFFPIDFNGKPQIF